MPTSPWPRLATHTMQYPQPPAYSNSKKRQKLFQWNSYTRTYSWSIGSETLPLSFKRGWFFSNRAAPPSPCGSSNIHLQEEVAYTLGGWLLEPLTQGQSRPRQSSGKGQSRAYWSCTVVALQPGCSNAVQDFGLWIVNQNCCCSLYYIGAGKGHVRQEAGLCGGKTHQPRGSLRVLNHS